MSAAKVSLKRPTPIDKGWMVETIKGRVRTFRDHAAELGEVSVKGIMSSTGCGHGCRHCGVSCGSFEKGERMSQGTVLTAQQRGLFKKNSRPILTGGEPLEHPQIGEVYSMLRRDGIYSTISATNGFTNSAQVEEFDSSCHTLNLLGDIERVSFHILDRWKGNSPGRDAILKRKLLRGQTQVDVITEFGAERETIISWLNTLIRILDSEEIRAKKGDRWVALALRGLPFMGGLEIFGSNVSGPVHSIYKVGRGSSLNGLWADVSIPNQYLLRLDWDIPSELGGTTLYPNGELVSYFLVCRYWFPGARSTIGTINDDPELLKTNLRDLLVGFFNYSLDKGTAEWDAEVEHHFQNEEHRLAHILHIFDLVKYDPTILGLFEEIMRRTDALDFDLSDRIHLGLNASFASFLSALEEDAKSSYIYALTQ